MCRGWVTPLARSAVKRSGPWRLALRAKRGRRAYRAAPADRSRREEAVAGGGGEEVDDGHRRAEQRVHRVDIEVPGAVEDDLVDRRLRVGQRRLVGRREEPEVGEAGG